MLIGICSDTHGHAATVKQAIAVFDRLGVERIVHCGDVGGQAVFDELIGRRVHFVWGNTDVPDGSIRAYLQTVGIPVPDSVPLKLEWTGRRLAVFHGHERSFAHAAHMLEVDYILHGHTHLRRDEWIGSVRFVNPGALYRARPRSIATLDLVSGQLDFHELDHP